MGKTNLDCAEPRVLLTSTSGKYVIKDRDMLCWPVPPVPLLGGQGYQFVTSSKLVTKSKISNCDISH